MNKKQKTVVKRSLTDDQLEALIEEATVDTYDEYEARVGFLTMIQDNVTVPFQATLNGEAVTVSGIDGNDRVIKALIKENSKSIPVDILDLEINTSLVSRSEWIVAYYKWERG
ncbi:MAG TPA: calcium-binding protein [Patescibacteria group bacterium]|nr:calcium-binding protein [Patescibacteria group bacterium]